MFSNQFNLCVFILLFPLSSSEFLLLCVLLCSGVLLYFVFVGNKVKENLIGNIVQTQLGSTRIIIIFIRLAVYYCEHWFNY
jgi:hypothetical protein